MLEKFRFDVPSLWALIKQVVLDNQTEAVSYTDTMDNIHFLSNTITVYEMTLIAKSILDSLRDFKDSGSIQDVLCKCVDACPHTQQIDLGVCEECGDSVIKKKLTVNSYDTKRD